MIGPITAIPAAVREEGGAETYQAALGFESVLLHELTDDLVPAAGPYASTIDDAFGEALLQGGGIGLSEDLYKALRP